jgi:hypothetical protein
MQNSSRLGTAQEVALSDTSAASAAFGSETWQIRVAVADVTGTPTSVRFRIGDGTPTAVAADPVLPTECPEYFTVTPGQRIAAILVGGTAPSAKLSVTEIA